MPLDAAIEAVLFYKTEPLERVTLASFLGVPEEELTAGLSTLRIRLAQGATRIIETGDTIQLVTAPEVAELIERLRADELSREIGKAGAETLSIVLYRGPISRAEIDHIRGVNSAFILRNLQIRGLINRTAHPTLPRSFQYIATPALYAHLGITKRDELPEFDIIMKEIDTFERTEAPSTTAETAPAST